MFKLRRAFQALSRDRDNVSHAFFREVDFWATQMANPSICDINERVSSAPDSLNQCPPALIKVVDDMRATGVRPRILDVGAGPFSLMHYFQRTGRAAVVAIDVLAREYGEILRHSKFQHATEPEFGTGEFLDVQRAGDQFDIVYISNALDHTASPALTWLNALKMTRVDGIIGHAHFVREATAETEDQLHRFDLYPDANQLWLDDLRGHCFSLTMDLPLRLIHQNIYMFDGRRPAFEQLFVKTGDDFQTAEFLAHVVEDLRRAFQERNRWAFRLEHFVNTNAGLGTARTAYRVDPDKA
jgi:hypothetical protein